MSRRIRSTAVVAALAALVPLVAGAVVPGSEAQAIDKRCAPPGGSGPLFTMRTRAFGTTNPVEKPKVSTVTGLSPVGIPAAPALPVVLPNEAKNPEGTAQGGVDTAWSGNVRQPGTPPTDFYARACYVSIQGSARAPMPDYPTDVRMVEPGTQFSLYYARHFAVPTWPLRVRWVGDAEIVYDKTIKAPETCFLACGGYDTGWTDLVIPPQAVGYFEVTAVDTKGVVQKDCFATVRGTCPA